ncbi:hypothetical protein PC123_g11521 [Phytophthora cactorum]|nr:hypothetical protein PC123_g11521 [Phytophthora cactorum]
MGAANSVRKLTIDSIALLEQLEPNGAELVAKRAVRRRVQQLLQQNWPTCRVLAFGSSESGLGFGGCDVDLGIYFEDMDVDAQGQFSPQERVDLLATACERLSTAFQVQEFVRNARVPVIKLWDPKRQVACDVCVGGINALLNTALLKYYGRVDPRVRPLVFAIKYWAKQRGINDSVNGTLSSYGYTLLLIFYLQSHYAEMQLPAVLSLFQDLQSQTKVSMLLERLQSLPTMELPSTFGTSEFNSVGALLAGFFDFYARRFNMEDEVAECPMLFFRDIPCPVEVAKADDISAAEVTSESGSVPLVGFAPHSPPIAIPVPPAPKTISPRACKERPWERGLSPSSSPMLRLSRKKKRARHGSSSSTSSSSPSSSLNSPSSGQSQSEKRHQQQRYQQQRHEQRRRNFVLLEPTRKCGGNTRSGRPQVVKVLCPS